MTEAKARNINASNEEAERNQIESMPLTFLSISSVKLILFGRKGATIDERIHVRQAGQRFQSLRDFSRSWYADIT